MREEVLLFGRTRALVGIITDPPHAARRQPLPAVILVNVGLVHRVGPNRLYVKLARSLAALGCDVAQGFHLSRPLPASEIPAWLESWAERLDQGVGVPVPAHQAATR